MANLESPLREALKWANDHREYPWYKDLYDSFTDENKSIKDEPGIEPVYYDPISLLTGRFGGDVGSWGRAIKDFLEERSLHKKVMKESLKENKRWDPKEGKLVPAPKEYK